MWDNVHQIPHISLEITASRSPFIWEDHQWEHDILAGWELSPTHMTTLKPTTQLMNEKARKRETRQGWPTYEYLDLDTRLTWHWKMMGDWKSGNIMSTWYRFNCNCSMSPQVFVFPPTSPPLKDDLYAFQKQLYEVCNVVWASSLLYGDSPYYYLFHLKI